MTYKQLCEHLEAARKIENDQRRDWRLGDDKIFVVHVLVHWDNYFVRKGEERRRISMYTTHDDGHGAMEHVGDLSPRELVQAAEFRAVVDAWMKGDLAELPASTVVPKERAQ